jgi:lipid II:glycine glycyltransferase (peptidoglycan interpeptide bridge formation enzyme)
VEGLPRRSVGIRCNAHWQGNRLMDEELWNKSLQSANGDLLQSWRWGEFKRRQGWVVERLSGMNSAGTWMAQILFRSRGPVSLAYIPRGPVMSGEHRAVFPEMMAAIDEVCRRRRSVSLIVEPSQPFQLNGTMKQHGFVRWMMPIQPASTLSIPVLDDESALQRMHHKTRYHVRLATRHGISIERQPANPTTMAAFHCLLAETAERNSIRLLSLEYLIDLACAFGDDAEVLMAIGDGRLVASAVMVRFGDLASYLFAASSTQYRGQGAGALLVFGSMQWARNHGCTRVDLGNVGNEGLRTFKMGFGGDIQEFPPPIERRYRPMAAWLARRVLTNRGRW